jgi:hypothetical protein
MLRSAASLFRVGGLACVMRSPNCSGLWCAPAAIPLIECALRERSADASSLLDRLREHSARAAGRRSVHHKFARQKLSAIAAAVSLQQQNQQQPQQQVAPSPREQLLLKKMTEKHAIGRGMPAKMQRRRMKLRVYNAEFQCYFYFREEDVEENSILGRGPGGQATNRRRQTCQIAHKPTGIRVRFSRFRSLYSNRKMARTLLSWQIEKKLFGVFSRLGAAELRQKLWA